MSWRFAGSCHSIELSYMTFTSSDNPTSPQLLLLGKRCPCSHLCGVSPSRRREDADLLVHLGLFYNPFNMICTSQDVKLPEDSSCTLYIFVFDIQQFFCGAGLKCKFLKSLFPKICLDYALPTNLREVCGNI